MIHPTAIIDPQVQLGKNVRVGAFCIIESDVIIGDNTEIMHHTTISTHTRIGADCRIFPYVSIGTDPQDITYKGEATYVHIGDNNKIREFSTINRGTVKGGWHTRIGHNNYLMAYVHIAHDCQIGNNIIFINGATLAGHVEIDDYAVIGAFSSVHQFARVGRNAYIGGYSIILQDILPYAKISQKRDAYNLYGANSIGMMRNGISRENINKIKDILTIMYRSNLNTTQAMERIGREYPGDADAEAIIEFIKKSRRGLLKQFE
jgi:UDP-N-acetylglucosamine acyltransferase